MDLQKKSYFHLWGMSKAVFDHVMRKKLKKNYKAKFLFNIIPSKTYSKRIFSCSASLLRVTKSILNIVFDLFEKNFFSLNPFLETIGKDDKISFYILKSKPAFKISFSSLSKLVEQLKIRLL